MKKISELPIGSRVKFGSLYGEEIVWLVADKNHDGYPNNSVTLLTKQGVEYMPFDAAEPLNTDSKRVSYGNNRYLHSNIRQWLNSESAGQWHTAQHIYDAAPASTYLDVPGFLHDFSDDEKEILLTTKHTVSICSADGGKTESVSDKAFLISVTEAGLTAQYVNVSGSKIALFNDTNQYSCGYSAPCATKRGLTVGAIGSWMTADAYDYNGNNGNIFTVTASNSVNTEYAYSAFAIRPACNISANARVTDEPDKDDCYTFIYNSPPTISDEDKYLGEKSEGFEVVYTVTDTDDAEVTVVEQINGVEKRTFSAKSGVENKFVLSQDEFDKLCATGDNTLTITVEDSYQQIATRTYTFFKPYTDLSEWAKDVADQIRKRSNINGEIPIQHFPDKIRDMGPEVPNGVIEEYTALSGEIPANTFFEFTSRGVGGIEGGWISGSQAVGKSRSFFNRMSIARLSENRFFIFLPEYNSVSLPYGMIATITELGAKIGTPTQLHIAGGADSDSYNHGVIEAINDHQVCVYYVCGGKGVGLVCVCDISPVDDSITMNTSTNLSYNSCPYSASYEGYAILDIKRISDTKLLGIRWLGISGNSSYNGEAQLFTIDNKKCSASILGFSSYNRSCCQIILSASRALLVIGDTVYLYDCSGRYLSKILDKQINVPHASFGCNNNELYYGVTGVALDKNHALICYWSRDYNAVQLVYITVSDTQLVQSTSVKVPNCSLASDPTVLEDGSVMIPVCWFKFSDSNISTTITHTGAIRVIIRDGIPVIVDDEFIKQPRGINLVSTTFEHYILSLGSNNFASVDLGFPIQITNNEKCIKPAKHQITGITKTKCTPTQRGQVYLLKQNNEED